MAKVEGLNELIAQLKAKERKVLEETDISVVVGYTQNYALYVHENIEAKHPVGQAKFLEQPFRELKDTIVSIVMRAVKNGASFGMGLLMAGLRIQRESQQLVPVDTGALKGSAFTRREDTGEQSPPAQSG